MTPTVERVPARDLRFWLIQCLGIILARQGGETLITHEEIAAAMTTVGTIRSEQTPLGVRVYIDAAEGAPSDVERNR